MRAPWQRQVGGAERSNKPNQGGAPAAAPPGAPPQAQGAVPPAATMEATVASREGSPSRR